MSAQTVQTLARARMLAVGLPPVIYVVWFRIGDGIVTVASGGSQRSFRWSGPERYQPNSDAHVLLAIEQFRAAEQVAGDPLDSLALLDAELSRQACEQEGAEGAEGRGRSGTRLSDLPSLPLLPSVHPPRHAAFAAAAERQLPVGDRSLS